MTTITFDTVWYQPSAAARQLSILDDVGCITVEVDPGDAQLRVFRATFEPLATALHSYPTECVHLVVRSDCAVYAVPIAADGRRWLHRYPRHPLSSFDKRPSADWHSLLGALCLEYPLDPPNRRWSWDKGFESYVAGVRQHVLNEEFWRREGEWPIEDTPHGHRPDGRPHPAHRKDLNQ